MYVSDSGCIIPSATHYYIDYKHWDSLSHVDSISVWLKNCLKVRRKWTTEEHWYPQSCCMQNSWKKMKIHCSQYLVRFPSLADCERNHVGSVGWLYIYGPRQANLVLIACASSEGSGEPAHPHSLARTSAACSYKHWVKRNLQTENQIPGPSEWLGMHS